MKAILGKCSYAAEIAYETQRELRELRGQHLPPLLTIPPPLVFELPTLSNINDDENDSEQKLHGDYDDLDRQETLRSFYMSQRQETRTSQDARAPPRRCTCFTATTHHQD